MYKGLSVEFYLSSLYIVLEYNLYIYFPPNAIWLVQRSCNLLSSIFSPKASDFEQRRFWVNYLGLESNGVRVGLSGRETRVIIYCICFRHQCHHPRFQIRDIVDKSNRQNLHLLWLLNHTHMWSKCVMDCQQWTKWNLKSSGKITWISATIY